MARRILVTFIVLVSMWLIVTTQYAAQVREAISSATISEATLLSTTIGGRSVRFIAPTNDQFLTANRDRLTIWHVTEDGQIEIEKNIFIHLSVDERIEREIAINPNGNLIAFSTINNNTSHGALWLLDLTSERATILVEEERRISIGSYQPQRGLVFSPDGTLLARTIPYSVELWDVESQQLLDRLGEDTSRHTGDVYGVAFSPDGRMIASAGGSYLEQDDTTIRLWNAETLEPIAILEGHTGTVFEVAFSPNGSLLASTSQDGSMRLWSMETFETLQIIKTDYWQDFSDLVFSPDGSLLFSPGFGGVTTTWDVQTGNKVATLHNSDINVDGVNRITSQAFNSDGTYLVTTSLHNVIQLWGIASGTGN